MASRGLPTFTVARRLGTSVAMIDATYGHHAHDTETWELERLEAFDTGSESRGVELTESGE